MSIQINKLCFLISVTIFFSDLGADSSFEIDYGFSNFSENGGLFSGGIAIYNY